MKCKGERVNVYKIEFDYRDDSGDWGAEYIEAHTVDEAIEIFRSYYPKDEFAITNVLKQIGKVSGAEAWANR